MSAAESATISAPPTKAAISLAASIIGRKGGLSRSPELQAARRRNALLGGRKPSQEAVRALTRVADAIPASRGEDRDFLIEAFIRLAPESLYQDRWLPAWGRRLESKERRSMRGWGPSHREEAAKMAAKVLRDSKSRS